MMMKKILAVCFVFISAFAFAQEKPDALKMYVEGNYAQAIKVCESEIAATPNRIDSYVVLCWALVANKQYSVAEQRASDGLAIGPNDLRLVESLGEAKYYLGKNKEALALFERYIAGISDSASRVGVAFYYMGEIYIRQAKYQHADIALSTAVRKEPMLERWWIRLGYAREMAGNYYQAVEAYDEALRLNSSSVDAERGRSRVSAKLQ